jgi:hypothetical protein
MLRVLLGPGELKNVFGDKNGVLVFIGCYCLSGVRNEPPLGVL